MNTPMYENKDLELELIKFNQIFRTVRTDLNKRKRHKGKVLRNCGHLNIGIQMSYLY
jgi:hypothetical protein